MVSPMASRKVITGSFMSGQKPMTMTTMTTFCGRSTRQLINEDLEVSEHDQLDVLAGRVTTSLNNNIMLSDCLPDIACFPANTKIPTSSLSDIWFVLRELSEEDVYAALLELESRNLISLIRRRDETVGVSRSLSNLYVMQHPLLRDATIYLSQKANPSNGNPRVSLEQRNDGSWNCLNQNATLYPRILSLHTGEAFPTSLPDFSLEHVEVLILNVSSSTTFFLPQFLERMENLKVLIISNYSSGRPALLANLLSVRLPQSLRRIHFDRVLIPLLSISPTPLLNLEKLSMISCEFSSSTIETDKQASLDIIFPSLVELEIAYGNNLSALPDDICNITTLQKLSVTNCPDRFALPDSIGQLSHLKFLALEACTALRYLPDSICMLKSLQFLDLSYCSCIQELPAEIGELSSLVGIDIRRCFQLIELPLSIKFMKSLRKVVCDEENMHLWRNLITFLSTDLEISVPKESMNLDWLL